MIMSALLFVGSRDMNRQVQCVDKRISLFLMVQSALSIENISDHVLVLFTQLHTKLYVEMTSFYTIAAAFVNIKCLVCNCIVCISEHFM